MGIAADTSWELMTDGGGDRAGEGAAACIVRNRAAKQRFKFAAFVGPCTGNEAEIMGALLGSLVLRALRTHTGQPVENSIVVEWVTDSKYLLHMAERLARAAAPLDDTTPNRALWELWRTLTTGFRFTGCWVRGHDGHRENEACDRACRWLQRKGRKLLAASGEGPIGQAAKQDRGESWILLDLQQLFHGAKQGTLQEPILQTVEAAILSYMQEILSISV